MLKYESESFRFVDFRGSTVFPAVERVAINVTRTLNTNEYSARFTSVRKACLKNNLESYLVQRF